jgi:hypothetical protein
MTHHPSPLGLAQHLAHSSLQMQGCGKLNAHGLHSACLWFIAEPWRNITFLQQSICRLRSLESIRTFQALERKAFFSCCPGGRCQACPGILDSRTRCRKAGLVELNFNILFLVYVDKTNNGSLTVIQGCDRGRRRKIDSSGWNSSDLC